MILLYHQKWQLGVNLCKPKREKHTDTIIKNYQNSINISREKKTPKHNDKRSLTPAHNMIEKYIFSSSIYFRFIVIIVARWWFTFDYHNLEGTITNDYPLS